MSCDVCRGTNSSSCPVCGDQPDLVACPHCQGLGLVKCYALSLRTGEEIDEDCDFCGGTGEALRDRYGNYHSVI